MLNKVSVQSLEQLERIIVEIVSELMTYWHEDCQEYIELDDELSFDLGLSRSDIDMIGHRLEAKFLIPVREHITTGWKKVCDIMDYLVSEKGSIKYIMF